MKRLFLCSQFHVVAPLLESKIRSLYQGKGIFINTSLKDKVYPDHELEWHFNNRKALKNVGLDMEDYDITGKSPEDIVRDLKDCQCMYVEGGNMYYLLQQAHRNGFLDFVTKKVEEGMLYMSTSAGSILAGPETASASRPGKSPKDYGLENSKGTNLVNFVVMPHWGDPNKKAMYQDYKIPNSYSEDYPYILLTDNQCVDVEGDTYRIVDVTKE